MEVDPPGSIRSAIATANLGLTFDRPETASRPLVDLQSSQIVCWNMRTYTSTWVLFKGEVPFDSRMVDSSTWKSRSDPARRDPIIRTVDDDRRSPALIGRAAASGRRVAIPGFGGIDP